MFVSARQEPSLFAVAKLLETGLVNMDRIEILWRPLTAHLLEVAEGSQWFQVAKGLVLTEDTPEFWDPSRECTKMIV